MNANLFKRATYFENHSSSSIAAAIELEEWFSKYVALLKRFAFIGASFDGFLALNCFDL